MSEDRPNAEASRDWPTPEYPRAGTTYECSRCGDVVAPNQGDKEAALLVAGLARKLCESCATEIMEEIDDA